MNYRVKKNSFVPKGQVLIMRDYSHPETPMFDFDFVDGQMVSKPAELPDGIIVTQHPDDKIPSIYIESLVEKFINS